MFETLPSNSNAFQAAKPLRVTDLTDQLCSAEVLLCARNRIFLSLSSSKKEKRAGERRRFSFIPPLSPAFSPLVPRGEREAKLRERFAFRTELVTAPRSALRGVAPSHQKKIE